MEVNSQTKTPPLVLADELTSHFKCPICGRLYSEPVISVKCGHTFCKKCAFSATHCPVDGTHCDTTQLVVNRLVVGQIEDLFIYCQYGVRKQNEEWVPDPSGCQEKIQIGKRNEHESQCPFAPLPCPNSEEHCGRFRKSELELHLEVCPYLPCQHREKGCEFIGTKDQNTEHLRHCGYRGLQTGVSVKDFNLQTRLLEENNKELRDHIDILENRVSQLEGNKVFLHNKLETCVKELNSLQSKYDHLQTTVDQLMTGRLRRSVSSPSNTADSGYRSRSSSSSNLNQRSPTNTIREEHWQMPFVFKCIGTLRGHKDVVWSLVADKYKVFSSGSDFTIKVWDMEHLVKGCVRTLEGHTGTIHTMAIHDGYLYSASEDRSIRVWNIKTLEEERCIENTHDNIISAMVISGEYMFTSTFSLIKVWELKTFTMKTIITGLHHWVRALALSINKDSLYSGSHNTIDIWNTSEPFNLKGKIDHSFGSVYSIAITPKYVVAGTYNRLIQVFEVSTYQHVSTLKGHISTVSDIAASISGRFLISGSADKKVMLILIVSGLSPGTYNRSIQVFSSSSYQHVQSLAGQMGTIHSLVTSLSGQFMFSASGDKSIQVWDLENMLPIQTLQRHDGSVNAVIIVGDFMLSGSEDKEIKVYRYFQMQMGFALQGVT